MLQPTNSILFGKRGMKMGELRTLVGKRIQAFRRHLDLTQDQLAEKAGLSLKHLGEIERGRGNPTLTSLENLAAALNVSIVQLFGYESERLNPEQVRDEIDLIVDSASGEECEKIMRVLRAMVDR